MVYCLVALLIVATVSTAVAQVPFWSESTGPYGGHINATIYSRNGTLFAATTHGLFRSTSDGQRWSVTAPEFREETVRGVATTNSGAIIATSSERFARSTDDGVSWTFWTDYGRPFQIANGPGEYLFGLGHGYYPILVRSTDDGLTWVQSTIPSNRVDQVFVLGKGLVIAHAYVNMMSRDSGATWSTIQWPAQYVTAVARQSDNTIFVAGNDSSRARVLSRSTDDGRTWSDALEGLEDRCVKALHSDGEGRMLAILPDGIARWSDTEHRWEYISSFVVGRSESVYCDPVSLATSPDRRWIHAPTSMGNFRSSDNGATWFNASDGMNAHSISSIATLNNGDIFAGAESDVYRSTDLGMSWSPTGSMPWTKAVACTPSGVVFAGGYGMKRSTDRGATWTDVRAPDSLYVYSIVTTPTGIVAAVVAVAVGFSHASFVSTSSDAGETWQDVPIKSQNEFEDLTVGPSGDLFLPTDDKVRRSSDRGATWRHVVDVDEHVTSILPLRDGNMVIGTAKGRVMILDSATGELERSGPLDTAWITSLAIDRSQRVYAATNAGKVFRRSLDGDTTWQNISSGIEMQTLTRLEAHPSGYLFLATLGGSVQRSAGRVSGVEADAHNESALRVIAQRATDDLIIEFTVASEAECVVQLHTVNGELAARIELGSLARGVHRVRLATDELASGTYSCELRAGARFGAVPVHIRR